MKFNKEKDLKDYLLALNSFGDVLYPKSDGRVEIPQKMVKSLGWGKTSSLKVCGSYGVLRVYNDDMKDAIGSVKVSGGRVRIPASLIKKVGLSHQKLIVSIYDNKLLLRAHIETHEEQSNKKMFIQHVDNHIDSPFVHQEQVSVNIKCANGYEFDASKETCLILPDPADYCISFRVLGTPFKFSGYWHTTNELVLSSGIEDIPTEHFYLIPGLVRKYKKYNVVGYLLAGQKLFSQFQKLIPKIKNDNEKFKYISERDCVILRRASDEYEIFLNPPEEPNKYQGYKIAQFIEDPHRFLKRHFYTFVNKQMVSKTPDLITTEHIPIVYINSFNMSSEV